MPNGLTVALLIVLNIAFHGTLVNEFKVPGTDFQKATDLIDAKFGAQKGAPLRVVIAAPAGQTLQTPERQAAVSKMLEQATAGVRKLDQNQKDVGAIADPLASNSAPGSQRDVAVVSTGCHAGSKARPTSYSSALASASKVALMPPAVSTMPFGRRVAVCP